MITSFSLPPLQTFSKQMHHICELLRANVQRSNHVRGQMVEVSDQMNKLFDHKDPVASIVTKYGNKRQLRKKEKR